MTFYVEHTKMEAMEQVLRQLQNLGFTWLGGTKPLLLYHDLLCRLEYLNGELTWILHPYSKFLYIDTKTHLLQTSGIAINPVTDSEFIERFFNGKILLNKEVPNA